MLVVRCWLGWWWFEVGGVRITPFGVVGRRLLSVGCWWCEGVVVPVELGRCGGGTVAAVADVGARWRSMEWVGQSQMACYLVDSDCSRPPWPACTDHICVSSGHDWRQAALGRLRSMHASRRRRTPSRSQPLVTATPLHEERRRAANANQGRPMREVALRPAYGVLPRILGLERWVVTLTECRARGRAGAAPAGRGDFEGAPQVFCFPTRRRGAMYARAGAPAVRRPLV